MSTDFPSGFFRHILDGLPDAVVVSDQQGRIVWASLQVPQILGFNVHEILDQPVEMLVPTQHRTVHRDHRARFLSEPSVRAMGSGLDLVAIHKDGSEVPVDICLSPVAVHSGLYVVAAIRDVSKRRGLERQIRRSEERYRRLFEESRDAICVTTPDGRIIDANQAAVDLFGYASRDELLKTDAGDLYAHPEDRTELVRRLARGEAILDEELMMRRKDGQTFLALDTTSCLENLVPDTVVFRAVMRDITEQRAAQRRQEITRRMEAIGRVAGGVAHDFNNLLTAIAGFAKLAHDALPQDTPPRADLEELLRAAEHGKSLVGQLLALGRRHEPPAVSGCADLNDLISEMKSPAAQLVDRAVRMEWVLAREVLPVRLDVDQFWQVMMNLIVNAAEAMPSGGTITVQSRPAREVPSPASADRPPNGWAVVSVADTGPGIDEDLVDRVFEPFVTTKKEGTGLGLSTVYAAVKQHGGEVIVSSEPGVGARFDIYLPVAVPESPHGAASAARPT